MFQSSVCYLGAVRQIHMAKGEVLGLSDLNSRSLTYEQTCTSRYVSLTQLCKMSFMPLCVMRKHSEISKLLRFWQDAEIILIDTSEIPRQPQMLR